MASACNPGSNNHPRPRNKESPNALLMNSPDADLLEEPYAQAVHIMGYERQDILQAVKVLQKRQQPLMAKEILQELMHMESEGRIRTPGASVSPSPSASAPRKCLKRPASAVVHHDHDQYGSDGEEREKDPESLEEDGGGGRGREGASSKMALVVGGAEDDVAAEPTEPPLKRKTITDQGGKKEKEGVDMKRVLALREENRRLKARHLCRKCREQPVSLTFLPCGHFSFCQQCGQSFQACPLCRKPILADVRTFLA